MMKWMQFYVMWLLYLWARSEEKGEPLTWEEYKGFRHPITGSVYSDKG